MLSDEEKEAIDYFKADVEYLEEGLENLNYIGRFITIQDKEFKYLKTILNLIEKQQAEIELAKQSLIENANIADERNQLLVENQKKDKMIDLMTEQLAGLTIWNIEEDEPLVLIDKKEVIEYFEKKVGE